MVFFITFLRALAACCITNAHYTGIYPTDIIANGGLIGDIIFFAVSGYCLYIIKYDLSVKGFIGWYGKRILRVYPPVLIMTAVFMLLGAYQLETDRGLIWWYIYPTYYHFVASIIVLYIPFFFIMKISALRNRLIHIMIGIALLWLALYFTVYDYSYYHIDTVREPIIRFLFMESMILGAWFRQNDKKLRNQYKIVYPILALVSFIIYFISKLLFSNKVCIAPFQFLNQVAIFALLYFILRTFCGIDGKLEKLSRTIKEIVTFISEMTLEIYVVQYVIIDVTRNLKLIFPINWAILTAWIVIVAFVLHKVCGRIYLAINMFFSKKKK